MTPNRIIPIVLGLAAGATLLGGLALSLSRARAAATPVGIANPGDEIVPGGDVATQEDQTAYCGDKRPKDFGFPEFDTAYSFVSMTWKKGGSASYMVRKGTADEIAAFYQARLAQSGWKGIADKPLTFNPVDPSGKKLPQRKGRELTWHKQKDPRELRLMVLDIPQKGSTAQATLSWSPLRQ